MTPPRHSRTEAPELWLHPEQSTDYGFRQDGVVVSGNTSIPVTVRKPDGGYDNVFFFENGWTGDKNSMRIPAIVAAEAGHMAVTIGYTNLGSHDALESNARDIVDVIAAVPGDIRRHLMGVSMGGVVALRAAERSKKPIETATLVASAGFIERTPTALEVVQHLGAAIPEMAKKYIEDPIVAAKVGLSASRHIMRRRQAIRQEIYELTHSSEHERADRIISAGSTLLLYVIGKGDKLIPYDEQRAGIQRIGFHKVAHYEGGHVEAVFNPQLTREILELIEEPAPESLALAA